MIDYDKVEIGSYITCKNSNNTKIIKEFEVLQKLKHDGTEYYVVKSDEGVSIYTFNERCVYWNVSNKTIYYMVIVQYETSLKYTKATVSYSREYVFDSLEEVYAFKTSHSSIRRKSWDIYRCERDESGVVVKTYVDSVFSK